MPFLIDEYTPTSLDDVFFHTKLYDRLYKMSQDNSIPHVILHGPLGSGKRTMTKIFLRMIYGNSIDNLYTTPYNIAGSGNKIKKETIKNSDNHIIINPTGTNFDRYIVHEIIKKYASSKTIELTQNSNSKFRTIQISNLDKLSHSAQTSLRRMIEVNASTCRFIMWCNNIDNVIGPLKSRCVCLRVPRPTNSELFSYLTYISILKNFNPKLGNLSNIVKYANGNIKTALWALQLHILGYNFKTNYDYAIKELVDLILNKDLNRIDEIRDIFFNTMITNYNGIDILRDVMIKLVECDNLSETIKSNIIIKTSEIEYNMLRGRREIIHFDSFVIQVMYIIEKDKEKNISYKKNNINTISNIKNLNY